MTTFDVFRCAEQIELIAAEIYAVFARQFAQDGEVRGLFKRLEAEEVQHAARVRLLASRYRGDSKILERVSGATALEGCRRRAEEALAAATGGAWGADLAAIKARLAALEADLARAHAQVIAADGHPALRDFFNQLALQDEAHLRLLEP